MDALRGALRRLRRYGGDGDRQQFWVDSNNVSSCYECGSEFGLFNRKHHCRVCGRVFCGRCTSCRPLPNASYCISGVEPAMEVLSGGYGSGTDERERVCHHCGCRSAPSPHPHFHPYPHPHVAAPLSFSEDGAGRRGNWAN